MALINFNTITLSDSGLSLDNSIISAHTSTIKNNSYTAVAVQTQVGFFLNAEKMLESPTNALRVQGFEGNKYLLDFQYPVDDTQVFLYYDLQILDYLKTLFKSWDFDQIIITTKAADSYTFAEVGVMKYLTLATFCSIYSLTTNPANYSESTISEFRAAVQAELNLVE